MDKAEEPSRATDSGSLGDYYNASQLRADTWTRLKSVAVRLANAESRGAVPDNLRQEAARERPSSSRSASGGRSPGPPLA